MDCCALFGRLGSGEKGSDPVWDAKIRTRSHRLSTHHDDDDASRGPFLGHSFLPSTMHDWMDSALMKTLTNPQFYPTQQHRPVQSWVTSGIVAGCGRRHQHARSSRTKMGKGNYNNPPPPPILAPPPAAAAGAAGRRRSCCCWRRQRRRRACKPSCCPGLGAELGEQEAP